MATAKRNRFAVIWPGSQPITERVAQLADGTLCFASSKTAAKRDLATLCREWRTENKGNTARRLNENATAFHFRSKYCSIGEFRVVDLDAPNGSEVPI